MKKLENHRVVGERPFSFLFHFSTFFGREHTNNRMIDDKLDSETEEQSERG